MMIGGVESVWNRIALFAEQSTNVVCKGGSVSAMFGVCV